MSAADDLLCLVWRRASALCGGIETLDGRLVLSVDPDALHIPDADADLIADYVVALHNRARATMGRAAE